MSVFQQFYCQVLRDLQKVGKHWFKEFIYSKHCEVATIKIEWNTIGKMINVKKNAMKINFNVDIILRIFQDYVKELCTSDLTCTSWVNQTGFKIAIITGL